MSAQAVDVLTMQYIVLKRLKCVDDSLVMHTSVYSLCLINCKGMKMFLCVTLINYASEAEGLLAASWAEQTTY